MELTASGDAGEKSLAMKRILKNIINLGSAVCYFDADGKEITKGKLRGDVSGLTGDVSGLTGDVNECEITAEDREKGVSISDLVSD